MSAAFNSISVIFDPPASTPEILGASIPAFCMMSPISLNLLSSFDTVASIRWSEELRSMLASMDHGSIRQPYFPHEISRRLMIPLW